MLDEKNQEKSSKEERIDKIAISYYSRKDLQEAIFKFCKNRETIPSYMMQNFGKRPDSLEYPNELIQHVKKGATSFHCSEELWEAPLEIKTEMTPEQYSKIRIGWDLLIDIDSKYLDYSKILAELIIKALEFSGIKSYGLKFSGSKGFHLIVPWKAFPKEVYGIKTKEMFPDYPRIISKYLSNLVHKELVKKITELSGDNKQYIKDYDSAKEVIPDLILVSPRHLFRAPYSLHEKTSLASIVITREQLKTFNPQDAAPLKVDIKNFYPDAEENEAKELLISALDWHKSKEDYSTKKVLGRKFEEVEIDKSIIIMPPCINNILKGLKDGKKRALFILINYFKSLNYSSEEIEKIINGWNEKNNPKLHKGYITAQLDWHKKQKKVLPPNCDKEYYKAIGICTPDEFCNLIKNPVNYTVRKQRQMNRTSLYKKQK